MSEPSGEQHRRAAELEAALYEAVGAFVLTFGEIEARSHICIRLLCRDPEQLRKAGEWDFQKRKTFAAKLIETREVPDSLRQRWEDTWQRAQKLAEHRNFIAHGNLLIDASVPAENQLGVGSFRSLFRTQDFNIKVPKEIEALTIEARQVVQEIAALTHEVYLAPVRSS